MAFSAVAPPPTLVGVLRSELRARHMSLRTEDTYVYWARDFIRFHGRRHPREMGPAEVEAYLAMLANRRRIAASTHNQALSALLFLYRAVLKVELPWLDSLQRPKRPQRLPVVLSVEEVTAVLSRMQGEYGPRIRVRRRHPLFYLTFERIARRAVVAARVRKPATPHTLRHAFATRRLPAGYDIRPTVRELLGHANATTTMIHTHVLQVGGPADARGRQTSLARPPK